MDWPGIEPWRVVVNSLECYMVMKVLNCGHLSYDIVKSFVRLLKFQRNMLHYS